MRDFRDVILKILKEEVDTDPIKSDPITNSSDFYFYKTMTGNLLLLPKSSNPKIISTVNKELFKQATDSPEEILAFSNNDAVNKACKTYHKDIPIDDCYTLYVMTKYNSLVDGGVYKFEATLPNNKREVFTSCIRRSRGGKLIDFTEWKSIGYYPQIGTGGKCEGNPWVVDMSSPETKKQEDFGQRVNFSIKVQMIK